MTPLLDARGLGIEGRLQPSDLQIAGPTLVALIGPNGGGKTSLLRALAGVEDSSGSVCIDGQNLAAAPPIRRERLVALLPASRDIVWPIAARDVIALGAAAVDEARVDELLDALELRQVADRPISSLSTGERSRVLLARVLAARPRLLLLDEPLANLDPYWVLRTMELLREPVNANQCAAIVSLHDLSRLEDFDRLLLVSGSTILADSEPAAIMQGPELSGAFRVAREGAGWRIRRPADPRSLP